MTKIELITDQLIDRLKDRMEDATSIYIVSAFVMDSGVKLLSPYLKTALDRGAEVKILTGDYLFVSQPQAIRNIIELDSRIECRMWKTKGISFHPKAYLFQSDNDESGMVIGSSNVSRSALTHGVEWNLYLHADVDDLTFQEALDQFMKSFYHEQTIPMNHETLSSYEVEHEQFHKKYPQLVNKWTEAEEQEVMFSAVPQKERLEQINASFSPPEIIKPREAQTEALEELEKTLEEDYDKAMVVMATGLGKTYLAGFFAQKFNKVLFIAHREEILKQAHRSFQHIMPDRSGGILNAKHKDKEADFVFASIFTLGIKKHLEALNPHEFDLIIVDEFHHAAANTYQRVLDYFSPDFLLGITATPDRLDGKDVYGLCDGNVAYQLHFIQAIQKGWLTPFHYYGIYDDTDYSQIKWLGTRYDEEELLAVQLREEMGKKVFRAWEEYKQTRTLAFCSSIRQADYLSSYFQKQGIKSVSLNSRTTEMSREEAIQRLQNNTIDIIFTVDLFNEGVDIPPVDTLLFVRPTESLSIFTQQIGRGLRLYPGKEICNIIDLIGNYRNVDVKLKLLDTSGTEATATNKKANVVPNVPDNCAINFDVKAIDLLKELARKKQPRKEKLKSAYMQLKEEIGRSPTYLELHLNGQLDSKVIRQEFGSYVGFLYWANEMSETEEITFKKYEFWFREVEKTGMAKSYKMVVLLYMLEKGAERWLEPVTPEEVAPFFHQYLTKKEYRKRIDFSDRTTKKLWEFDEQKTSDLVAKMPMTKWSGSSKGIVSFEENKTFKINIDVEEEYKHLVHEWTKDICLYRLHVHFERKGGIGNRQTQKQINKI